LGFLQIFDEVLKKFDGCPGDILWLSWRYLMGFVEMFDVFTGNI